jgi:hypothetical protein
MMTWWATRPAPPRVEHQHVCTPPRDASASAATPGRSPAGGGSFSDTTVTGATGKEARKGAAARHLHPAACTIPCVHIHVHAPYMCPPPPGRVGGASQQHMASPDPPTHPHTLLLAPQHRADSPRPVAAVYTAHVLPRPAAGPTSTCLPTPETGLTPDTRQQHQRDAQHPIVFGWVPGQPQRNAGQGSRQGEVWEFPRRGVPPVPCSRSHARLLPLQLTPAVRCPDNDPHGQQHRFTPAPLVRHSTQQHSAQGEGDPDA